MEQVEQPPPYFHLLSDADRSQYAQLRECLMEPACKNRRNRTVETFTGVVKAIKTFVMRNDEDDWKRGLVCGLFWVPPEETVALSTRQLRLLTSKCKSSINGSFQLLGYGMGVVGADCSAVVVQHLPALAGNFQEIRQWTLRQRLPCSTDRIPSTLEAPFIRQDMGSLTGGLDLELPSCSEPEFDPLNLGDKMNLDVFGDHLQIGSGMMERSEWDEIDNIGMKENHHIEFADLLL
jgi:hypothetical protein